MSISIHGQTFKVKKEPKGWTPEKDAKLKAMRGAGITPSGMAKALGMDEARIYRRLKVLNLVDDPWTPAQDTFLRKHYLEMDNYELAKAIESNPVYVGDRLRYLGLRRPRGRRRKAEN